MIIIPNDLSRIGRAELIMLVNALREERDKQYEAARYWEDRFWASENQCEHQQMIIDDMKQGIGLDGIYLRGWHCPACGVFNGELREKRSDCRSCGLAKK